MSHDRPLVILDLDNTCICAVEMDELDSVANPDVFPHVDLDDIYRIYERPGLQEWLDQLFKDFQVAVWTAAGLTYGLFVIRNFILVKPEREIEFYMWDDHCSYSYRRTRGQAKHVKLLQPLYDISKAVLIDDNKDVLKQTDDTIDSKYFDVTCPNAQNDYFLTYALDEINRHMRNKAEKKVMLKDEIQRRLELE